MTQFDEGFRLSYQQRTLWLRSRKDTAPRVGAVIDTDEALDPKALEKALETVVERHEILRTRFLKQQGLKFPLQVIDDAVGLDRCEDDLSGLAESEQATRLEELFAEELQRPFEGEKGSALAVRQVRRGPGAASLVVSLPALSADPASLVRLVEEVAVLLRGASSDELGEPLQYVDYCDWQEEILTSEDSGPVQGRAFWQRQRPATRKGTNLPFAHSAREHTAPRLATTGISLDALRESLTAGAAELGVTPADLLRAAWWVLAGRLSGEDELVVGELFSGRDDEELVSGIGPFARTIPLAGRFGGDLRFAQALERLNNAHREASAWQALFSLDDDESERVASSLTVGFEAFTAPATIDGSPRFTIRHLVALAGPPLKLSAQIGTDSLVRSAALHYDPQRFDREEVETVARRFGHLLAAAVADPERRLRDLPLLTDGEHATLVEGFRRGEALPETGDCVHQRIAAWAERTPQAPAVRVEDAELSYGELDRQANRLARHLRGLGVLTDVPVVLYLERSPELMVGALAILKAGGAYVAFDTSQPSRRIAMMLESFAEPVIVTQSSLLPNLPELTSPLVVLDRDQEVIGRHEETPPPERAFPESLCYVVFTSGSTGRPKGVGVEHRQLTSYLDGVLERLALEPGASFASVSTFSADLGNTSVFGALTRGGCLHLLTQERATDPHGLAEYFARYPVDCLKIVPSHLEALQGGTDPAGLMPRRCLVVGGEASKRPWGQELLALAGDRRVVNHYGPSETTVGISTFALKNELDPRWATIPIGRATANNRSYLLDPRGEPVPPWLAGELHLGGRNLTRGYIDNPPQTAERFVPDPFATGPGERLYRTGDLARALPTGEIEFLGRRDHQVKFHGFRVELGEIRHVLNSHPQVRDSVVRLVQDEGGRDLLAAYYVSRQEVPFSELRQHLAGSILEETLPNLFVHLRKLPLTLNGKVNFEALPSVEEARSKMERPFVEPRNATEEALAAIWAEILPPERVSVEDNFFELGGHSLLATRIIARVREQFAVEVPLKALFETPTVAALARHILEKGSTAASFGELRSGGGGDLAGQLDELEGLSGDEVAELLDGDGRRAEMTNGGPA